MNKLGSLIQGKPW